MKVKKALIGGVVGLGALAISLFVPIIPTNSQTLIASNNGGYELRLTTKQTPSQILLEKVVNSLSGNESNQRVIRVYGPDSHGALRYGTGYILATGPEESLVLTNNHVIDDMERSFVFDGKNRYTGRVVATDPEKDLALVSILSDNKSRQIVIGPEPKPGEYVTVRTLDPEDSLYRLGPDSSRRDLMMFKDDGHISSKSKKYVQELKQERSNLQLKLDELVRAQHDLYKPYLDSYLQNPEKEAPQEAPQREPARDFGKLERDTEFNEYKAETGKDAFIPGMSGSAVFNKRGELVGVASFTHYKGFGFSSFDAGTVVFFPESMPEDVKKQIVEIGNGKEALNTIIGGIDSQISKLENPVTYGFRSPLEILAFLKDYLSGRTGQSLEQTSKP